MRSKQCQFHPTLQANISGLRSHKSLLLLYFYRQDVLFKTIYMIKVLIKFDFSDILFFFLSWITVQVSRKKKMSTRTLISEMSNDFIILTTFSLYLFYQGDVHESFFLVKV